MALSGKGFIIDAANAYIENSDGAYHLVTASSGEVVLDGEQIDIAGGWSAYDLANINTKKSIMINLEDVQFDINAMQMTTGGTKTDNATVTEYKFGVPYIVDSTAHTIILPDVAVARSIKITGLTETTEASPTATEFKVTVGASSTTLLFNTAMDGKNVMPKYEVSKTGGTDLVAKTTDFPKSGLVVVKFPIYASESLDSKIECYGQFLIYKAQIQQKTTYGGSYKSASKYSLSLKGLDPRRSDQAIFKFSLIPA